MKGPRGTLRVIPSGSSTTPSPSQAGYGGAARGKSGTVPLISVPDARSDPIVAAALAQIEAQTRATEPGPMPTSGAFDPRVTRSADDDPPRLAAGMVVGDVRIEGLLARGGVGANLCTSGMGGSGPSGGAGGAGGCGGNPGNGGGGASFGLVSINASVSLTDVAIATGSGGSGGAGDVGQEGMDGASAGPPGGADACPGGKGGKGGQGGAGGGGRGGPSVGIAYVGDAPTESGVDIVIATQAAAAGVAGQRRRRQHRRQRRRGSVAIEADVVSTGRTSSSAWAWIEVQAWPGDRGAALAREEQCARGGLPLREPTLRSARTNR